MSKASPMLNGQQALLAPCTSCQSTPCCWFVPLKTVEIQHYDDMDQLVLASCFGQLEVGARSDGRFVIYYLAPCRHLSRDGQASCTIFGTPLMPQVCHSVTARGCWFRAQVTDDSGELVRLDEERIRQVAELYRFNTDRNVSHRPSWHEVKRTARALERDVTQTPNVEEDEDFKFPWLEAFEGKTADEEPVLSWDEALGNPCTGCQAYCCTHFEVEVGTPRTWTQFDRLRFLLQFPNTEVLIRDETWSLSIRTQCSHLSDDKTCGLFGDPRRPRFCVDYNAHRCHFKERYAGSYQLRVGYTDFLEVATLFEFDLNGQATTVPSMVDACERVLLMRETGNEPIESKEKKKKAGAKKASKPRKKK